MEDYKEDENRALECEKYQMRAKSAKLYLSESLFKTLRLSHLKKSWGHLFPGQAVWLWECPLAWLWSSLLLWNERRVSQVICKVFVGQHQMIPHFFGLCRSWGNALKIPWDNFEFEVFFEKIIIKKWPSWGCAVLQNWVYRWGVWWIQALLIISHVCL